MVGGPKLSNYFIYLLVILFIRAAVWTIHQMLPFKSSAQYFMKKVVAFYSAWQLKFTPLLTHGCSLQLVWLYGALGFRFSILYVIICRRQNRWNWIASCHDSANALTPPKPFGYASADLCHTSPPASTPHNTILCGTNCATLCGTTTIQKYFYHFFYFFQYF